MLVITQYYCHTNSQLSRPRNAEELFNLRHASAHNIIERSFGVLKWCFRILIHPPQFDMDIQAHVPPALAALHNFIRKYNPDNIADFDNVEDPQPGACMEGPAAAEEGQLADGLPGAAEREQTNERRDRIAQEMWTQYQAELSRCNLEE
jgi:DDE superfamily endonuclease